MRDNAQLAEALNEYAGKHRMMFGLTPEWNLFVEIVKALQAQEAEKSDVVPAPKTKPRKGTKV